MTRFRRCDVSPRCDGYALLLLLAVLGLAAVFALVSRLGAARPQNARDPITESALAQAKEALIGYSAIENNSPGTLPCPDVDGDGDSDWNFGGLNDCRSYIGLLPWHTLGVGSLRDANGECLWYVLSPGFRNTIPTSLRGTSGRPAINPDAAGELTVYGPDGTQLSAPVNPAIALVIAPGQALSGRTRTGSSGSACPSSVLAANYLDTGPEPAAINNATGNGSSKVFVASPTSDTFNDRVIALTHDELFSVVSRRVLAELRGPGPPAAQGLLGYLSTYDVFPGADTGLVPIDDLTFPAATANWLDKDRWANLVSYTRSVDLLTITISLNGASIKCTLYACR